MPHIFLYIVLTKNYYIDLNYSMKPECLAIKASLTSYMLLANLLLNEKPK